jgi:hypothetical protein
MYAPRPARLFGRIAKIERVLCLNQCPLYARLTATRSSAVKRSPTRSSIGRTEVGAARWASRLLLGRLGIGQPHDGGAMRWMRARVGSSSRSRQMSWRTYCPPRAWAATGWNRLQERVDPVRTSLCAEFGPSDRRSASLGPSSSCGAEKSTASLVGSG